jgi:hypothetical protein
MSDIMELTDLDFDDNSRNNHFGGGLELLMNDKIRDSNKPVSDINLDDLNNLENELNDLAEDIPSSSFKPRSDLFNAPNNSFHDDDNMGGSSIRFMNDDGNNDHHNLGKSTSRTDDNMQTWDGYGKFNNIPLNPDKVINDEPKLSAVELLREKFKYLKKLEALEKKGVELSKKYSMDSSLQEMKGEYETIIEEKEKQSAVKFQGKMLMAFINGIEYLNEKFDPFDVKLEGWGEQINENLNDYDDIFLDLYEKYKGKASLSPELKLLFQLGGSAMMVHMSNTIFKSAMPGMDEIFKQNPDLMRSFQSAAVNTMSQNAPGLSGFMNNIMNNSEPQVPRGTGPPPPLATQGETNNPRRPGNNDAFNEPTSAGYRPQQARPEMKGPSDLSNILSGLKTKTINIQQTQGTNEGSTISLNDLKDMQMDGAVPKRSGRRKKCTSNTVSIDI